MTFNKKKTATEEFLKIVTPALKLNDDGTVNSAEVLKALPLISKTYSAAITELKTGIKSKFFKKKTEEKIQKLDDLRFSYLCMAVNMISKYYEQHKEIIGIILSEEKKTFIMSDVKDSDVYRQNTVAFHNFVNKMTQLIGPDFLKEELGHDPVDYLIGESMAFPQRSPISDLINDHSKNWYSDPIYNDWCNIPYGGRLTKWYLDNTGWVHELADKAIVYKGGIVITQEIIKNIESLKNEVVSA